MPPHCTPPRVHAEHATPHTTTLHTIKPHDMTPHTIEPHSTTQHTPPHNMHACMPPHTDHNTIPHKHACCHTTCMRACHHTQTTPPYHTSMHAATQQHRTSMHASTPTHACMPPHPHTHACPHTHTVTQADALSKGMPPNNHTKLNRTPPHYNMPHATPPRSHNTSPQHVTPPRSHNTSPQHNTTLNHYCTQTPHHSITIAPIHHTTKSLLHPHTTTSSLSHAPAHHHIITHACSRTTPHHHSRMHQYAQANSPTSIECEENIHPCTYSHAATNTQSKQMDGGSTHTAHIHSWTEGAHIHTAHIHSTCSILQYILMRSHRSHPQHTHTQVITHAPPPSLHTHSSHACTHVVAHHHLDPLKAQLTLPHMTGTYIPTQAGLNRLTLRELTLSRVQGGGGQHTQHHLARIIAMAKRKFGGVLTNAAKEVTKR